MREALEPKERPVAGRIRARDHLRFDLPAGLVVFLVALPLCLGIAFASGAPLIAGLITGIVGGLLVAPLSKSALSVSGPAAGLTLIVFNAIADLGSYEAFLTAVCVGGVFQVVLGFLRAGIVAYYFPSSVIKGMLSGIGVVLILKQLPHAFGYDADYEGDLTFAQPDGQNTLTEIPLALGHLHLGATAIAIAGLILLVAWGRIPALKRLRYLPGPLMAVVAGLGLNSLFALVAPELSVVGHLLVGIPDLTSLDSLRAEMRFPELSVLTNPDVYKTGAVLCAVASIETLLCVEAVDKQDPFKRVTPTSHELKAQGIGNLVSGLLGGIPMTAVIVRGSANVQAGGRTWMAAFFQGVLLVSSVVLIPSILNQIPLAALAAILLHIGYKLAPLHLFKSMWDRGVSQFLPYIVTIAGVVFIDLLKGVAIGLVVGIFFVLRAHVSAPYYLDEMSTEERDGREHTSIRLADNVSFLNKASLNTLLATFADGSSVEIDARGCQHIDDDAVEEIQEFVDSVVLRRIDLTVRGDCLQGALKFPSPAESTDSPA